MTYSPHDHDPGECRDPASTEAPTFFCPGCRERREIPPDLLTVVLLVLWLGLCVWIGKG